jgi:hypothetical protein
MTNFAVNGSTATGDMSDRFGESVFKADLIGKNLKGSKTYKDGNMVELTGTISLQRIQGTWIVNDATGTFYFTP